MCNISFVKKTGLSHKSILFLYLLKISVALLLGWITMTFTPGVNDYWSNNIQAIPEHALLMKDPVRFITSIGYSNYDEYGNYFGSVNSYWNDLEVNLLLKIIAVLDIFTRGNYFVNSIFFASFGFIGHVAIFRLLKMAFPGKDSVLIIACFLLPSTLYFTSGVHKDTLLFGCLGLYCYSLYVCVVDKLNWRHLTTLVLSFTGILLFRNYTAILLLPCSLAFALCHFFPFRPWKIFLTVYLVFFSLAVLAQLVTNHLHPFDLIVQKLADFKDLGIAGSQLPALNLQPTIGSFIESAPPALGHVFLRPYVFEHSFGLWTVLACEITLFSLLTLALFWKVFRHKISLSPLLCFMVAITISSFLIIGYIVPNTGSIARYRSLFLPFLIAPALYYRNTRSHNMKF